MIVTDRQELDEQIEKVFTGVDETIYRTTSGADLLEKLNAAAPSLICSLVHKFGNRRQVDYDQYIVELKNNLRGDFRPQGDIYVFVDECHRTQSGKLHEAMRGLLPDSVFIGFTGTPLLKSDKLKSAETFGKNIHTYKFDEAVKDAVALDSRYEARHIEQELTSPERFVLRTTLNCKCSVGARKTLDIFGSSQLCSCAMISGFNITKHEWEITPSSVRIAALSLNHQLRLLQARFNLHQQLAALKKKADQAERECQAQAAENECLSHEVAKRRE